MKLIATIKEVLEDVRADYGCRSTLLNQEDPEYEKAMTDLESQGFTPFNQDSYDPTEEWKYTGPCLERQCPNFSPCVESTISYFEGLLITAIESEDDEMAQFTHQELTILKEAFE